MAQAAQVARVVGSAVDDAPDVIDLVAGSVAELAPLNTLSRRRHFTADDNLVFCSTVGEHLNHQLLRRRNYTALEKAKLRRIRFHDLRHCFGSIAVRAFPLSDVQAMLGHAHVTTTMRYVHHRPGADDAARLSSAFAGKTVPFTPVRFRSAPLSATQ